MRKILRLLLVFILFGCMQKQEALNGEYKMSGLDEDTEVTIVFNGTEFAGSSGVNRYFGNFEQYNNKIKFNLAGSTMMMGPQKLMKFEQEYIKNLHEIEEFSLKDNTLVLKNNKGVELKFQKM